MNSHTNIFFSYARKDLAPLKGDETSWLEELQDRIRKALDADNPRVPYDVWFDDTQMVAGDAIDAKVGDGLSRCDLAVAFVSRNYLYSDDCTDELRKLREMGKTVIIVGMIKDWHGLQGTRLGDLGHQIFNVDRTLCTAFWDEEDPLAPLLGSPLPSKSEGKSKKVFQRRLLEVVNAIETHARAAQPVPRIVSEMSDPGADIGHPDVFLASPTQRIARLNKRLKKSLESKGFSVVCYDLAGAEAPPGWSMQVLTERISACHLFAQIVGDVPGREDLFGSGLSLVEAQYEAALAAGVDRHLLLSPDIAIEDAGPAHRAFLDRCNCQSATFEDFQAFLIKSLEEKRHQVELRQEREKQLENLANGGRKLVAIDFDPADRDKYEILSDLLAQKVGIGTTIIDDPKREILKSAVDINDGILLVYGPSRGAQMRAVKHFEIFWQLGGTAGEDFCKLAIGDAAPQAPSPPPKGPNVHYIKVHDSVDLDGVNRFLSSLGVDHITADTGT